MKGITRKEEMILMAILNLGSRAYLVSITDFLSEVTEEKMTITSVHLPLNRLENQGLIRSAFGESTAVRGGRRKRIYAVTPAGHEALNEYKRIHDALWRQSSKSSPQ
jgi:PadR family transcriptional regulator PadR